MLFELLHQSLKRISDLDPRRDAPAFARAMLALRPELAQRWAGAELERLAQAVAGVQIGLIRELPDVARAAEAAVFDRSTFPAARCALVGALGYLVRPRDLLPDDLPGGLGFLDDSLVLRTVTTGFFGEVHGRLECLDQERRKLRFHALCLPAERLPEFARALDEVWALFHRLLGVPREAAEATTKAIIEDPFGRLLPDGLAPTPPAPIGPAGWLTMPGPSVRLVAGKLHALFAGDLQPRERELGEAGQGF
ncbi:MAG TPA: YkvA family protein [Myxococcota bacterium]|nr:YkvA family protein [Myxococcota bacterium]HRY96146.1 YkvA family protein [Myxococcota bacterium]HSA22446.1 YkvA family protein [Myxococcota bacterium]